MSVNDYVNVSIGGTIAKVAFGLIFLMVGVLPDESMELGSHAMGVIIGLALIAWGVYPYIVGWQEYKEDKQEESEAEALRRAEEERRAMAPCKCPSCGANTHGSTCEYCGSPLKG